jgi:RNA polymerase sigma factor (TIGR02999 family)
VPLPQEQKNPKANQRDEAASDPELLQEITQVLKSVHGGDPRASESLLELVYQQLRRLARSRLRREPNRGAGMTLDATALVRPQLWKNRGHFFGAAALAMRRILVERARHRKRIKHGGGRDRVTIDVVDELPAHEGEHAGTDLIALDEALNELEKLDARKAKIVSLRYFAGLSIQETAAALDLSPGTIKNEWVFVRAWLHKKLSDQRT